MDAQAIKALEDAKSEFLRAHKELMEQAEKADGEVKEAKSLSVETKNALEKLAEKANKAFDRLAILESRVAYRGGHKDADGVNVGREFVESQQFKSLLESNSESGRARLRVKNIVNATGQNQPLVPADRRPGIIAEPNRMLRIRDLLMVGRTSSNLIEYTKENVFTNSAASQYEASPERFEGVKKAKSNITFTLATAAVVTIAHYMKASKQVLGDAPQLESYINGRLTYGLKLEEEEQILNGTGAAGELNGLNNQATAYNRGATGDTGIDTLRKAITQGQLSNYMVDGIVLNPADWEGIELTKDNEGRYIWARPEQLAGPALWGLPVVPSNTQPAGTFLVGAFGMAAQLWDREDASVQVGFENDDFTRNLVTMLAEERVALTVFRPAALIKGSL
jgi:HK97 family phage major capsid protein